MTYPLITALECIVKQSLKLVLRVMIVINGDFSYVTERQQRSESVLAAQLPRLFRGAGMQGTFSQRNAASPRR